MGKVHEDTVPMSTKIDEQIIREQRDAAENLDGDFAVGVYAALSWILGDSNDPPVPVVADPNQTTLGEK